VAKSRPTPDSDRGTGDGSPIVWIVHRGGAEHAVMAAARPSHGRRNTTVRFLRRQVSQIALVKVLGRVEHLVKKVRVEAIPYADELRH
jgi:hypothetical protein